MADLEWQGFFIDVGSEPSPTRSKVALSIFDSPESVEAKPKKPKKPEPEAEKPEPEKPPKPEAPGSADTQGKWEQFMELFYEGGKKKVKNPNSDTKDKYPEVQVSTAMKDQQFAAQVKKEFEAWLEQGDESEKGEQDKADFEEGDQVYFSKDDKPSKVLGIVGPAPGGGHMVKIEEPNGLHAQVHSEFLSKEPKEKKEPEVDGEKEKDTQPAKKKPEVGSKIDSLEEIVPGIFIQNQHGVVGRITSHLPDGGFRYRQYDQIAGKWKGTQKIDKELAEKYFSGQTFTVVDDPKKLAPEGAQVVSGTEVAAGDTVWVDGKPHQVKKVEDDENKHGMKFLLDNGDWMNMHDVDQPKLSGTHSLLYHKKGELEPAYKTGEKVYLPSGVEVHVHTSKKHPSGIQTQVWMPDGHLKWVDEWGLSKENPKPKKEKADIGDKVTSSSQLEEGDWISSHDPDDPSSEYIGKITEVFGTDDPLGAGVMVQDYDPDSGKLLGKPWHIKESDLPEGDTTKTKPLKVKKGLTGKEVTDPKKLKEDDVLRIHEYNGGKVYTAQVVKNEDGWIVYNIVNPKTGKILDTRTVSPKAFAEELQVARLPASKIPAKLKPTDEVNPFSLILKDHAQTLIDKAQSAEQTEDLKEDVEHPVPQPEKKQPKGKTTKVDKGKWKLQTEQVDWDDIKVGDMVHTTSYGPQRVVGSTSTGVRLESGVVLTKSQIAKTKGKYTVSRGDKPQKGKAPPVPERPKGHAVTQVDQVQEGDVIEYEHNGTTYRGEVVSWDTPGEKFRVRIIYPPEYVAKFETYDEATGEKKFKTPSFDEAKINKRKPRILTKEEMKGYDAEVKKYTQKVKDIDVQYAQDVAEYEGAMAGKSEITTGPLQNLQPPKGWNHGSSIARDADRFYEQYKEMLGNKVKSTVDGMSSGKSYWSGQSAMWDEMSDGERKLAQSAHKAAPEFKKLLTDEEWSAWQSAISSWQGTSGGTTAHKLMGGLENLGVEGGPKYFESSNVQHYREEGRKNEALHRAISKAMAYSQLVYDALGVDHVLLYRGTKTKPVQGAEQGKKITTTTARELASFSINPSVAYSFAGGGDKRVVKYRVPVSRLFISPITYGPLSSAQSPHSENEYVVAGQDGMEGKVMPKSTSSYSAEKMKLASHERRPLFGPLFDDDVLVIEFEREDDDWLRSPVKETWWPGYCKWYDQWAEENEPRVASRIMRLAQQHAGFRRELLAVLRPVKRIASIFDSPDKVAVSIFDAPAEANASDSDTTFDEWFAKKYDGGKEKVQNPNPQTKDKYPEVATSTAMKDQQFAAKVYAEYQQDTGHQAQSKPEKNAPEEEQPKLEKSAPEDTAKVLKPSELKVGDKIRYSYKGNEFIGDVVAADDDEVRANLYHPKTGKKLRFKPVTLNPVKMEEWKVERADDWHRPPPLKIKPGVRLVVPDPDLEGHEIEVADVSQDDEGKWVLKDTTGTEWDWGKGFKVKPPKPEPPTPKTESPKIPHGLNPDDASTLAKVLQTQIDITDGHDEDQEAWAGYMGELKAGNALSPSAAAAIRDAAEEMYADNPNAAYDVSAVLDKMKSNAKKTSKPKPKTEEILNIEEGGFKQVGPQTGSNPGGLYEDEKGDRWYVKTPKSEDRARNEILAGKLYELAGIGVPDLAPATRDGKFSVASKIIPGLSQNSGALRAGKVPGVLEGIAVDAWLGNWDVVGLDYDNLLVDDEGKGRRVDTGGALRYRAMGAPKGDAFGDEVTELDAFTDPDRKSGSVFHHATSQQIVDSIDRVLEIPEDKIREMVDQWGPKGQEKDKLLQTLLARRESLKKQRDKYAQKIASISRVLAAALLRPEFRGMLERKVMG